MCPVDTDPQAHRLPVVPRELVPHGDAPVLRPMGEDLVVAVKR